MVSRESDSDSFYILHRIIPSLLIPNSIIRKEICDVTF